FFFRASLHILEKQPDRDHGVVRLHRVSVAGLAAALSARLLIVLSQDWNHRVSDYRRDARSSQSKHAGAHAVYRWWWSGHSGKTISIRLHHDRVRRDFRFPRTDLFGHDAEDDREGNGYAHDRIRKHVDGRRCRRSGADRRDVAFPGRLLCYQHATT